MIPTFISRRAAIMLATLSQRHTIDTTKLIASVATDKGNSNILYYLSSLFISMVLHICISDSCLLYAGSPFPLGIGALFRMRFRYDTKGKLNVYFAKRGSVEALTATRVVLHVCKESAQPTKEELLVVSFLWFFFFVTLLLLFIFFRRQMKN
jgi:hypothetical protein